MPTPPLASTRLIDGDEAATRWAAVLVGSLAVGPFVGQSAVMCSLLTIPVLFSLTMMVRAMFMAPTAAPGSVADPDTGPDTGSETGSETGPETGSELDNEGVKCYYYSNTSHTDHPEEFDRADGPLHTPRTDAVQDQPA